MMTLWAQRAMEVKAWAAKTLTVRVPSTPPSSPVLSTSSTFSWMSWPVLRGKTVFPEPTEKSLVLGPKIAVYIQ